MDFRRLQTPQRSSLLNLSVCRCKCTIYICTRATYQKTYGKSDVHGSVDVPMEKVRSAPDFHSVRVARHLSAWPGISFRATERQKASRKRKCFALILLVKR